MEYWQTELYPTRSKTLVQFLEKRHHGFESIRAFSALEKIGGVQSMGSLECAICPLKATARSTKLFAAGLP
jgi:hypothetical protein